jgi:hypothetical protein
LFVPNDQKVQQQIGIVHGHTKKSDQTTKVLRISLPFFPSSHFALVVYFSLDDKMTDRH